MNLGLALPGLPAGHLPAAPPSGAQPPVSSPTGCGASRRCWRAPRSTFINLGSDVSKDGGMPGTPRGHSPTANGAQLLAAIEHVEQLLPPIGTDAWPERTGQLGAAVDAVRSLTCAHPVSIDQRHTWPRPYCRHCGGHGWYWDDPDTTAHGWTPCRYCLTTGVELHGRP